MPIVSKLGKPCYRCGKMFIWTGRQCRFCDDCLEISRVQMRLNSAKKAVKHYTSKLKKLLDKTKVL